MTEEKKDLYLKLHVEHRLQLLAAIQTNKDSIERLMKMLKETEDYLIKNGWKI